MPGSTVILEQCIRGLDSRGNGGILGCSPNVLDVDLEIIAALAQQQYAPPEYDRAVTVLTLPYDRVGLMMTFKDCDRHGRHFPFNHVLIAGMQDYRSLGANPFGMVRGGRFQKLIPGSRQLAVVTIEVGDVTWIEDPAPPGAVLGRLTDSALANARTYIFGVERADWAAEWMLRCLPLTRRAEVRFTTCLGSPEDKSIAAFKRTHLDKLSKARLEEYETKLCFVPVDVGAGSPWGREWRRQTREHLIDFRDESSKAECAELSGYAGEVARRVGVPAQLDMLVQLADEIDENITLDEVCWLQLFCEGRRYNDANSGPEELIELTELRAKMERAPERIATALMNSAEAILQDADDLESLAAILAALSSLLKFAETAERARQAVTDAFRQRQRAEWQFVEKMLSWLKNQRSTGDEWADKLVESILGERITLLGGSEGFLDGGELEYLFENARQALLKDGQCLARLRKEIRTNGSFATRHPRLAVTVLEANHGQPDSRPSEFIERNKPILQAVTAGRDVEAAGAAARLWIAACYRAGTEVAAMARWLFDHRTADASVIIREVSRSLISESLRNLEVRSPASFLSQLYEVNRGQKCAAELVHGVGVPIDALKLAMCLWYSSPGLGKIALANAVRYFPTHGETFVSAYDRLRRELKLPRPLGTIERLISELARGDNEALAEEIRQRVRSGRPPLGPPGKGDKPSVFLAAAGRQRRPESVFRWIAAAALLVAFYCFYLYTKAVKDLESQNASPLPRERIWTKHPAAREESENARATPENPASLTDTNQRVRPPVTNQVSTGTEKMTPGNSTSVIVTTNSGTPALDPGSQPRLPMPSNTEPSGVKSPRGRSRLVE